MVSVAFLTTPPIDAEIAGVLFVVTCFVDTINVAKLVPTGTVTVGGTVANIVLLLAKLTVAPPAGADLFRVTVAVDRVPPITFVGLSASDDTASGTIVKVVNTLAPE
jgi:hypothetical protein